jgi:dimeric dUTPase (all-alpha-NTP-PPase superfamily)
MWMTEVSKMCDKHLRGEYVECLMILGTIKKKRNISGFIKNDLIELVSLKPRFYNLKSEMIIRGFKAVKDLNINNADIEYLDKEIINHKINKENSLLILKERCPECRKRFEK